MRVLVLIALVACGGTKRYAASTAHPDPVSVLAQRDRIREPVAERRLNGLHVDKAVRHRASASAISWQDSVAVVGSLFSSQTPHAPAPPPPAQPLATPAAQDPEKLVVEAWLDL